MNQLIGQEVKETREKYEKNVCATDVQAEILTRGRPDGRVMSLSRGLGRRTFQTGWTSCVAVARVWDGLL